MLLGIEPRNCKVCQQGLYRDKTMLRGGWWRAVRLRRIRALQLSCQREGQFSEGAPAHMQDLPSG